MNYLELLRFASPEAALTVTALALLGIQFAAPQAARRLCFPVAVVGILITISTIIWCLPATGNLHRGMMVISPLTSLFKIICLTLAFFTLVIARDSSFTAHRGEYFALVLFATIGLMLLVGTEELLMIFIGLELTGLSLYILTAFNKSDILSVEAGLKYFLFGSTASAFTLFGLSLVYGMCGSTNLDDISRMLATQGVQALAVAGISMTLIGLAFKIAAAPFHLWAPDTYQVAPVPSAAFIASGSKVAAFFVLGKVLLIGFGMPRAGTAWLQFSAGWQALVAALAALSIITGNIAALAQTNLRRLLAYSAVAHAGYTLLGLLATGKTGFSATLFYTTTYAFTVSGAFAVVALARTGAGGDNIRDFAGLYKRSPFLALCMGVFLLSLAGLPPLLGFFGKFYLFAALLKSDSSMLWLVVLALAGSLVSLYYYLAVLRVIFLGVDSPEEKPAIILDGVQQWTLVCLCVAILFLGIAPQFLASLINNAL